jgi:predicted N-acetyltransferase YhbS
MSRVKPVIARTPEELSKTLGLTPAEAKEWQVRYALLMLLARLAVARHWPGKGLGSGLLKDAMLRTLQAADIAGIRAFAVHAKDDEARALYKRFDFIASPSDPYHLFRLPKDTRALLKDVRKSGSRGLTTP